MTSTLFSLEIAMTPKNTRAFILTILLSAISVSGTLLQAQTVVGGQTPDPSAMLDVQSTSKGVLFPRVPNSSSVSSPATGLMIFNTGSGCLEINLGTPASPSWQSIKCEVRCGAKISATEWKRFMCHNLGAANTAADPLTPSWEINGGYWQWGRPAQAAAGPTGPNPANADSTAVTGWTSTNAPNGSWVDTNPMTADPMNNPCPAGYRIPTIVQWDGVVNHNTAVAVGPWNAGATEYGSGYKFGDDLFLPAAGGRLNNNGALYNRGLQGNYWSSTQVGTGNAGFLTFLSGGATGTNDQRALGLSVRCIEN